MHSGIDAWQIKTGAGIRGIASRVQWDDRRSGFPYCTFTIRRKRFSGAETEYDKRLRAIRENKGWLNPYLTVQAYCEQPKRSGNLVAVAVAKTEDVIAMIANLHCDSRSTGNASFWIVNWEDMRAAGYQCWVWRKARALVA